MGKGNGKFEIIDVGSVVCQGEREHKGSKNYSKYFPSAISTASFLDHESTTLRRPQIMLVRLVCSASNLILNTMTPMTNGLLPFRIIAQSHHQVDKEHVGETSNDRILHLSMLRQMAHQPCHHHPFDRNTDAQLMALLSRPGLGHVSTSVFSQ